jgi:hypothetical protein
MAGASKAFAPRPIVLGVDGALVPTENSIRVEIADELPNRGMILSHAENSCACIEVAGIAREAATAA